MNVFERHVVTVVSTATAL